MPRALTTVISVFLIALVCTSCSLKTHKEGEWNCRPLPDAFQESDLLGTWQAKYGVGIDTLVLKENGTFTQIYTCHPCESDISFENSGNQWWLENRESGGIYLHLEGMQRCNFTDELCFQEGGGGGNRFYWDYCEDRGVKMPDEVVLMVIGTSEDEKDIPRGIKLAHMPPSPDSTPFYFIFQEE